MQHSVDLKTMPSLLSIYRKIFFARKPGWDEQPLPKIQVDAGSIQISQSNVALYADVCGFNFDGETLPPTYLYVMAFRLHATVFTHNAMTIPLLGMIHLKNSITQYRQVTLSEAITLNCELIDSRQTDLGLEFDLISRAHVGSELVWESTSVYLHRIDKKRRRVRPPKGSDMSFEDPQVWQLNDGLGRRYAKASGDYNLIHLSPILSKRFGFERALAHGMWSKARCVAELLPQIDQNAFTVEVAFKLPLFMPGEVTFKAEDNAQGIMFELRDPKGRRPHLTGELRYL